jgi:hypothetical protein
MEFVILRPCHFLIRPTGCADPLRSRNALIYFTTKARNGLLEDNKSGPDNQIRELGQTELPNESFAARNERYPEQT